MRVWLALIIATFFTILLRAQNKGPATSPSTGIPSQPGWHQVPNSQLATKCPSDSPVQGNTGCKAIIGAWNGGVADTKRNRLIIWGGGHQDCLGNEVYALDLNSGTLLRLTESSPITNVYSCPEAYTDGRPSARHTYGGLAYIPTQDQMFVYGGSKSNCGFMSTGTWLFDLQKLEWHSKDPHAGPTPANTPGAIAEFDPDSGTVFLSDTASFFRYDPVKNAYTRLASLSGVDYHLSGVIDSNLKLFFMIGGPGQLWAIDIKPGSHYALQDWSHKVSGCDSLLHARSPGLAYEPEGKFIVGWAGGDTVILFHPETRTCTSQTYPGGPPSPQENGTFGRFRYFPALGVFALVNDWKQNAFLLRLAPANNPVAMPASRGE
jgi:hypothetical protein